MDERCPTCGGTGPAFVQNAAWNGATGGGVASYCTDPWHLERTPDAADEVAAERDLLQARVEKLERQLRLMGVEPHGD